MVHLPLEKERPMFRHAAIQGSLALIIAIFLASGYAWDITARATTVILNYIGIRTEYVSPLLLMYVRLLDGTIVGFQVLMECSGLITVAIFAAISTFTIGLLKGSILTKTIWFLLSIGTGLVWNLNRLVIVIAVAYNFGLTAFSFVHYLLAPFVDFIWVVSMWSLGMSWLKSGKEEIS